jgi:cellobiose-specific phosphotransferase system component IIA
MSFRVDIVRVPDYVSSERDGRRLTDKIWFSVEGSEPIWLLKCMIEDRESIPPDQQRLIFAGKQLDDCRTMADYHMNKETSVMMLVPRGPREAGKALAERLNLTIGGAGKDFASDFYPDKGLYAYRSGRFKGHAYFGTGGTFEQMRAPVSGERYRPWDEPQAAPAGVDWADAAQVLAMVARAGSALQYASAALRDDRGFQLQAVEQGSALCGALRYASALRSDRDVVMPLVAQNGNALQHASEALRNDKEVVLAAVAQSGWALQYALDALRNDKEVVLAAVAQRGSALQDASEALQGDKEVVLTAAAQDSHALASWCNHKVPEALQQDPTVRRLDGLDDAERALPRELLRLGLLGHLQFLPKMLDEVITVEMLPSLGHDELKELGMAKMGDRMTFMKAVKLPENVPPTETAQAKFKAFYQRMGQAEAIQGLMDTPLSSLREAVAFITGPGAPSQADLMAGCDEAEARADQLLAEGPDEHGLEKDEIAAIHLYTQNLMFRPLNRALWSKERGAVKPYWGYIRLLQHALFKLPKSEAGTICRGIKEPFHEPVTIDAMLDRMLAMATESSLAHPNGGSGEPIIWWGFSSCSTNQQAAMSFLGDAGQRVLYTIEGGSSARDVRTYSAFQQEAEVLMPFGSAFTVVSAGRPAPGLLLVTLRQTHNFALPAQADPMEPEPEPM